MPQPLYLKTEEHRRFATLPPAIRGQWTIEAETLTFTDTPERRSSRMRLMTVEHVGLRSLREEAPRMETEKDIKHLLQSIDLSLLTERDLAELCFALGPDALTLVMDEILTGAQTPEDGEALAHFAGLRHALLLSSQSSRPSL